MSLLEIKIETINPWFAEDLIFSIIFMIIIILFSSLSTRIFIALLEKYPKLQLIKNSLLLPGVLLHELSHIISCLIFNVKIKKITLFNTRTGSGAVKTSDVSHKSPFSILFISFAPIIFGSSAILVFINLFTNRDDIIYSIAMIYLIISIVMTCGPSGSDIKFFIHNAKNLSLPLSSEIFFLLCTITLYNIFGFQLIQLISINYFLIHIMLIIIFNEIFRTILIKLKEKSANGIKNKTIIIPQSTHLTRNRINYINKRAPNIYTPVYRIKIPIPKFKGIKRNIPRNACDSQNKGQLETQYDSNQDIEESIFEPLV